MFQLCSSLLPLDFLLLFSQSSSSEGTVISNEDYFKKVKRAHTHWDKPLPVKRFALTRKRNGLLGAELRILYDGEV